MTDARFVRSLRALGHPVRLGIMQRLAHESEICACDFGDAFQVSQPTVSEHLRVLREAGLVRTRRQGTTICYTAEADALAEVAEVIASLQPLARTAAC